MVSKAATGTEVERIAIAILEDQGYKVHRTVRTPVKVGKFFISQSNDVFGCIDLIAKKKGERTRWVQVTKDKGIGRKKKDLSQVPWDKDFDSVEVWIWKARKLKDIKAEPGQKMKEYNRWKHFQLYRMDNDYEPIAGDIEVPVDG